MLYNIKKNKFIQLDKVIEISIDEMQDSLLVEGNQVTRIMYMLKITFVNDIQKSYKLSELEYIKFKEQFIEPTYSNGNDKQFLM